MTDIPIGKYCLNSKLGVKCPYYQWFSKEGIGDVYCCNHPEYAPYFPKGRYVKYEHGYNQFVYKKQDCLKNTMKK